MRLLHLGTHCFPFSLLTVQCFDHIFTFSLSRDLLQSEGLSGRLAELSRKLTHISDLVHPERLAQRQAEKTTAFQNILDDIRQQHLALLERRKVIEKRKEIKEQIQNLKVCCFMFNFLGHTFPSIHNTFISTECCRSRSRT